MPFSSKPQGAAKPHPSPRRRSRVRRDPSLVPAIEVARACEVTLRTLSDWEVQGRLIPVRSNGRRYYEREEFLRFWATRIGIVLFELDEFVE
ncbi:MAG TPA: MerR family transcriptional regulator [Roseococcus sp.]|jgi:hypothetical protein|nr:MerR family transcriptional regulator [Roseococcus sp.]